MPLNIRPMTSADASAVIALMDRAHAAVESLPVGTDWSDAQLRSECTDHGGWVAFDLSENLNAFILLRDLTVAWEISLLATDLRSRGRGVMGQLLSFVLQQKPSDRELWLEVHESNHSARRLYVRHGLVEVGRRPKYYADGGAAILYNYG